MNSLNELIQKIINSEITNPILARKTRNSLIQTGINMDSEEYKQFMSNVKCLIAERREIRKTKFDTANGEYNKYADVEYKKAGEQIKIFEMLL